MGEKPIEEVERNLKRDVATEIENLQSAYAAAERACDETDDLAALDSYLSTGIDTITERIKRAREWERKLESCQDGLLSLQQVKEQMDDGPFEIQAEINRATRYIDEAIETVQTMRDSLNEESELDAALSDLVDSLETHRRQLTDLNETVEGVDNSMMDSGLRW